MKEFITPITSMLLLAIIALVAMSKGINSGILVGITAAIAGIGGYGIKKAKNKIEHKE